MALDLFLEGSIYMSFTPAPRTGRAPLIKSCLPPRTAVPRGSRGGDRDVGCKSEHDLIRIEKNSPGSLPVKFVFAGMPRSGICQRDVGVPIVHEWFLMGAL